MGVKIKPFFLLFLLFPFYQLSALEVSGDAETQLKGEYNRGSYNNGEVSLVGKVMLDNFISFKTGFSYGQNTYTAEISAFFKTEVSPFKKEYISPLSFSLSYIFNGIIEYDVGTHSIFPSISYKTDRFGATIGTSFRLTSFFGESPQFESIISFYVFFNFIKNDFLVMGVGCGTFNDFDARNMGAIWLDLNADIRINKMVTILNELVLMQSGIDGMTTAFYGISYKGGVRLSW